MNHVDYELTLLPGVRRLEEPRPPAPAGRGRVVILSQEMKSNWRLGLLEDRAVQGGTGSGRLEDRAVQGKTGSGRLQQGEESCDRILEIERKERWSCSGGGGVALDRYPVMLAAWLCCSYATDTRINICNGTKTLRF